MTGQVIRTIVSHHHHLKGKKKFIDKMNEDLKQKKKLKMTKNEVL
jgi:hypothetical protein